MSIPAWLLVHTATVEPYTGTGSYNDQFGPPFDLPCYAEWGAERVLSSDGEEVIASGRLYADPVTPGTEVPVGSQVSVSISGITREGTVIVVDTPDSAGLTGLAHRRIIIR